MAKTTSRKKRKTTTKASSSRSGRSSRKSKAKSKRRKIKRSGRGWIFHVFVILSLMVAAWVLWLDHTIQQHFEGNRWALPARVFARPLELFPGKKITVSDLQKELQILGYRRVKSTKNQGEFSASDRVINFYTRGFSFIDGQEQAQKLSLRFSGSEILSLKNIDTKASVALARIEPVEIAKIFPAHHEDRVLVKLEEVPPFLIKALLSTEDRRFYDHNGIDPKGIIRAFLTNLKAMKIKQGASTLTQQLIKNFYLTHERTYWRKLNELVMALLLEVRYEKNDILEAYLNEVFLGQDNKRAIHGFGLAAEYYFAAPLRELRSDQLALLVGMVKGPSYYDPRRHPERAKKRRNVVLKSMSDLELIDEALKNNASSTDLGIKPRRSLSRSRYPAFTELVRKQLVKDYDEQDLRSAGLRIFTTLDPLLQDKAEKVLENRILNLEKQKKLSQGHLQGAMIITDISSGEIQAVVGGRDQRKNSYNRAINAKRHIGSLIKPVVYLKALEKGRTLASLLKDEPVAWEGKNKKIWRPENYDKVFHGEVPLILALQNSYNAATVWLGRELGPASVADRLKSLGLGKSVPAYPSLLLGAVELSPLEISRVYQTLANDGFSIPPRSIRAVLTQDNKPLQRFDLRIGRTIDPGPAYLIKYAMTEVVRAGTAKAAANALPGSLPLAGKTGTTGDLRDSWFAGFDGKTLGVVWLGRDDNKSAGLTGSSGALRVWIDLMKTIPSTPVNLDAPEKIEWYWVNQLSGKITDKDCAGSIPLPFESGSVPDQLEDCHQSSGDDNGLWPKRLFEGWLN